MGPGCRRRCYPALIAWPLSYADSRNGNRCRLRPYCFSRDRGSSPYLPIIDCPGPHGGARWDTGPGYGGVCCAGKLGEGGTTLRGGRNRRRRWISLGYVLGIAVVIVLIIGLILVILPDPLAH